jgi:hypothetical protein
MKIIKTLIILLLIISCSNKKQITEFEEILGDENSKTLTHLVDDFETEFLKKYYSHLDISKAYRQFVIDVKKQGGFNFSNNISEKSKLIFEQSNLRLEIYSIPDSIWIKHSNNVVVTKIRYKNLTSDGTFQFNTSESSYNDDGIINKDSILNTINKNHGGMNFSGRYKKALETIFQESGFVNEYIDTKDAAGSGNPSIFVSRILSSNIDFKDYFIKRLILTELVYIK